MGFPMSNPLVFMTSPDQIAFPINAYTKANFLSCFHDSPFTKIGKLTFWFTSFLVSFLFFVDLWMPDPYLTGPGRR